MSIDVLAISGSLRGGSKNTVLLEAMARLAPDGVRVTMYEGLGRLPLFNPDLDDLDRGIAPSEVLSFRAQLAACHGVLICSPEYAHGVAGAMKNALDWLVGSGELVAKPTLVLNASPNSFHAHNALLETLRTMDCKVLDQTMPQPPLGGKTITVESLLDQPERAAFLTAALGVLKQSISEQ